ncbi:MAG: class I SAM-dependent methyltransferase [Nitrospirae bacterium]|nr:class I SAM-dependent methyltransferase [Nitrospirota bacterium]
MESKKFDPEKLAKLNDPKRLEYLDPDLIWGKLAFRDAGNVIEIGAGTGFFALIFSRRLTKGKVYACDISAVMIDWMEQNLPEEARGRVIPVSMQEDSVPLPDGAADLVYMINLHHELDEPLKIIAESLRLLKDGGKLMIIDWKKTETPEGPPLDIRVAEETIEDQLRRCGLTSVRKYDVLPFHNFFVAEKK